jgi:type I restriction enzyme, S subunit
MDAEQLLEHFDRVAEAPGSIAALRRFILDLAVRGKLVDQDPNDEPASELLKQIQIEKEELMKNGKIKKQKPFPLVTLEEQLFSTPSGWSWVQLADISQKIHYGFGASSNPTIEKVRLLRITDIQNNVVNWDSVPGCEITDDQVEQFRLENGDMLIARTGGTVGKSFLVDQIPVTAVFASYLIRIQGFSFIYKRYLKLFIESSVYWKQLEDGTRGTGQPNVNAQTLGQIILVLPPLSEQHRIVAKVDELMDLCDRLEAAQKNRENLRDRLVAASLHQLNQAADSNEEFFDRARFYFDNLAKLSVRSKHIKQLRQTIASLAICGKLVPQDPTDESAKDLFKYLQSGDKKYEINDKSIKQEEQSLEESNSLFEIPNNWIWLSLQQLFDVSGGIQKTPARTPGGNAFPYLGVGNVHRGYLDLEVVKQFELKDGELNRRRLEYGDILVIEGNGSLTEIGRCAIWRGEIENCVHQNHVIRCRPIDSKLSPFALLFLNSPAGATIMQQLAITSSGLYSLSVGKIRKIIIPLPPLLEQYRIVAKVDELMALCDQLESQITNTLINNDLLLESLLNQALDNYL